LAFGIQLFGIPALMPNLAFRRLAFRRLAFRRLAFRRLAFRRSAFRRSAFRRSAFRRLAFRRSGFGRSTGNLRCWEFKTVSWANCIFRTDTCSIFDDPLVYFVAISFILWQFGTFCGLLIHCPRFGILYQEKSGDPVAV
jgi:hypothetical protein